MGFCAVFQEKDVMALEQNKNVTRGEIALTYIALSVLSFTALTVGFYSWIFSLFIPALLAYTLVRAGWKHALLQSGLFVLFFSFIHEGFFEPVLTPLFAGVTVGVCVRRRKTLLYTVSLTTVMMLAAEIILYFSDAFRADSQLHFAQNFAEQSAQVVSELGLGAKESAMLIEMMQVYTPAVFLLSMALCAYGIVFFLRMTFRKKAPELAAFYPRFRDLQVTRGCLLVWMLSWGVGLFSEGVFSVTMANLAVVLSSYIIVCGFAVLVFWMLRVRSVFLRVLLCVLLLWFFSFATPIAFALGVLDMSFHFRTKKRGDRK